MYKATLIYTFERIYGLSNISLLDSKCYGVFVHFNLADVPPTSQVLGKCHGVVKSVNAMYI